MFILSEMRNVIRIRPEQFHLKLNEAIADELNKKLANKVLLNVGLCVALHDILKIEESYILPGDEGSHCRVTFRYVIFRPFVEEILLGKIRSCSQEGVHVTMDFFEDILIPPTGLQHPSRFDENEQAWVWEYDVGEGNAHDLFMDAGELIRFKVTSQMFQETCPTGPNLTNINTTDSKDSTEGGKLPYLIKGSINEPGLGLVSWWNN